MWGRIKEYIADVWSRKGAEKKERVKITGKQCPKPRTSWLEYFLETGDVIHVQGQGVLSRLIRWFSRANEEEPSWASHTAMVLRAGERVEIIEARKKVIIRPLSEYATTNSKILACRKPGGISEQEKEKMIEKAEHYHGMKYGVPAIIMHALDRIFNNKYIFRRLVKMEDYPICSWVVAYVYQRVLGYQFGVQPDAAQPDDILDHCVEKDWEFVWADSKESVADFCKVYGLASGDRGGQ